MALEPKRAKAIAQLGAALGMMLLALTHFLSKTIQHRIFLGVGGFFVCVICANFVIAQIARIKKKLASKRAGE